MTDIFLKNRILFFKLALYMLWGGVNKKIFFVSCPGLPGDTLFAVQQLNGLVNHAFARRGETIRH
jgi:hypothetical protein